MLKAWEGLIDENRRLVEEDQGPEAVTVVSGSVTDQAYWRQHFAETARDVFRASGGVAVTSVFEETPKGNFLGTFNAWAETRAALAREGRGLPDLSMMSMVFGKGKRLSPFTQALGNRKPAFLTPARASRSRGYLRTVDLSNLYSNALVGYLRGCGFRGLVAKWGDEVIIPGLRWRPGEHDFSDVDAVRFVWQTEVTETLAREKEWVVFDEATGQADFEFARQEIGFLRGRLAELEGTGRKVAVNLGSLAVSHDLLDAACEVLGQDLSDGRKAVDWDPYGWMALFCRDEAQWRAEAEYEERIGKTGIRQLTSSYPDLYQKTALIREALRAKKGRPMRVRVLDFGNAFWVDVGLHVTLRRTLEALTEDTEVGAASRRLFGLPHERDRNGNIIVGSTLPASADIRDSVIVGSVILDESSVVRRGVVVGGRHRRLDMPHGGGALFCAADRMTFAGERGLAFLSVAPGVTLPTGGRHTTLFFQDGPLGFVTDESVWDYSGENYSEPILGNPMSFEEAGEIMSRVDGQTLDARREIAWRNSLG